MKKWNHLILAIAVTTLGMSLSAQTSKPSAGGQLTDNAAVLSSPRYLEEHPELLRGVEFVKETRALKAHGLAALTRNAALRNSPRFLEAHPELLRAASSAEQMEAANEADSFGQITDNKAVLDSPRFRETHPELLRVQSVSEIAPRN